MKEFISKPRVSADMNSDHNVKRRSYQDYMVDEPGTSGRDL